MDAVNPGDPQMVCSPTSSPTASATDLARCSSLLPSNEGLRRSRNGEVGVWTGVFERVESNVEGF